MRQMTPTPSPQLRSKPAAAARSRRAPRANGASHWDWENQIFATDVVWALRRLPDEVFDVAIIDPPYNIGKDFGGGKAGDMRALPDYLAWAEKWFGECERLVKPGGVLYLYGFAEILAHFAVLRPFARQRWLAWHYTNKTTPNLRFWQRSHESILCLWRGDKRPNLHVDSIREEYTDAYKKCVGKTRKETLCRYNRGAQKTVYNGHENGALPRDVIKIPALAGGAGRRERWFLCRDCGGVYAPSELRAHDGHDILKHPTQKPAKLTEKLIRSALGGGGGRVLIPFVGSGAECVVAKQLGVSFCGAEANREYVKLAEGWLRQTGRRPCGALS